MPGVKPGATRAQPLPETKPPARGRRSKATERRRLGGCFKKEPARCRRSSDAHAGAPLRLGGKRDGGVADAAKVELAGAEVRQQVHVEELVLARHPEVRQ